MSIKFGSIVFVILAMFIAKVSMENFQTAEAREEMASVKN
jgi:hypothetical protein